MPLPGTSACIVGLKTVNVAPALPGPVHAAMVIVR